MALVLPMLRLSLLVLNVYGTFKSMKPPPQSQRSVKNGQGPSTRAMQLRKRDLKSCLALWVVWAMFSAIEGPMDSTIGLITPFYNELKCIVTIFLLVARSHGAEAIFLHIIHPLLRPYVPAVDDILSNLHSVFDLLTLLFFLPFEYISYRWHQWRNPRPTEEADGDDPPNDDSGAEGGEVLRMRLRPRTESQQLRIRDADRQAHVIFRDIDDAQGRVRNRTRSQPPIRINARGGRAAVAARNQEPGAVGLRTRRRVLEYPPVSDGPARGPGPGSRMTGVHHVYPVAALDDLPPAPSLQPFPALPSAPSTQPVPLPSQLAAPTAQSVSSYHEIWYPSESAHREHDSARRTPSPIYPPLPAAYKFTPRRSDPLPPPPRIITPTDIVSPTPRRASASNSSIDQNNRAGPSRSAEPFIPRHKHERTPAEDEGEDFFGRALEPSIQAAEMDMDVETLSARDDSSASTNGMEVEIGGEGEPRNMASQSKARARGGLRKDSVVSGRRGKRKAAATSTRSLRRSTRTRSSSVETDEFGFTVRPESSTLGSTTADSASTTSSTSSMVMGSSVAGPSRKKPLARTKPAVKSMQRREGKEGSGGETSSDEESVKKRRKLGQELEALPEEFDLELLDIEEAQESDEVEGSTSRRAGPDETKGRGKRKRGSGVTQTGTTRPQTRAMRATKETVSANELQPQDGKRR